MSLSKLRYEVSIDRDGNGFSVAYFEPTEKEQAQELANRISAALAAPYHVRLHIIYFDGAGGY